MQSYLVAASLAALAATGTAHARDFGLSATVGTTGLGLHVSTELRPSLNARIGANLLRYSRDISTNDVDYDLTLKMSSVDVLLDFFPNRTAFRVSTGLTYNGNQFEVVGKPNAAGSFRLNNNTYTAAETGQLNGNIDFRKVAPYLGIGWGNAIRKEKGWGFTADAGVLFQGSPRVSLRNSGCNAPAPICSQIDNDVAAEERSLREEVKGFRYFPVVRVGATYRF